MTRNIALLVAAISAALLFTADVFAQQLFGDRTLGQPLSRQSGVSNVTPVTPLGAAAANAARASAGSFSQSGANKTGAPKSGSLVNDRARFKRGNRKATDFVGADGGEARDFVGSEQAGAEAAKEIRSAVESSDIELAPDANRTARPALPPRVQMNPPRLQLALDFAGAGHVQVSSQQADGLAAELPGGAPNRRSVTGGAATGEVNSRLTVRLEKALPGSSTNRFAVSVAGTEATVRGAVASARDRKLAELMLLFEPGIDRVQNLLEVRPGDEPEALPSPPNPAD